MTTALLFADFKAWVRRTPQAWRTPSRFRRFALYAYAGILLDWASTSFGISGPIREMNPVVLAGAQLVGSLPLFMTLATVALMFLFSPLAARPQGLLSRTVWGSMLFASAVKGLVGLWNIMLIQTVLVS